MKINPSIYKNLGLSEAEASIYATLLREGRGSASDILPHTSLSRPNLYYNLDLLRQKGLVIEIEGKKRLFEPASPARLKELAQAQVAEAENVRNRIDEALPELLQSFTLATDRPDVVHHDGIEGIENIYARILESKDTLLIFHSQFHRGTPELKEMIDRQIQLQRKRGIKIRVLFDESFERLSRSYVADLRKHGTDPRILTDAEFTLPAQILLFENTVAISTLKKELTTLVIENELIATTFRKIFETLWSKGKADVREAYETSP